MYMKVCGEQKHVKKNIYSIFIIHNDDIQYFAFS